MGAFAKRNWGRQNSKQPAQGDPLRATAAQVITQEEKALITPPHRKPKQPEQGDILFQGIFSLKATAPSILRIPFKRLLQKVSSKIAHRSPFYQTALQ